MPSPWSLSIRNHHVRQVKPEDVHFLVEEHLYKGRIAAGLQAPAYEMSGRIAWLSAP